MRRENVYVELLHSYCMYSYCIDKLLELFCFAFFCIELLSLMELKLVGMQFVSRKSVE